MLKKISGLYGVSGVTPIVGLVYELVEDYNANDTYDVDNANLTAWGNRAYSNMSLTPDHYYGNKSDYVSSHVENQR